MPTLETFDSPCNKTIAYAELILLQPEAKEPSAKNQGQQRGDGIRIKPDQNHNCSDTLPDSSTNDSNHS